MIKLKTLYILFLWYNACIKKWLVDYMYDLRKDKGMPWKRKYENEEKFEQLAFTWR